MSAEQAARQNIDKLLSLAGWHVCDVADANIHVARGVAIREFPLKTGHGFADYLLYIDARAAGVIEAKKEGVTLTGVETQSDRYAQGLPEALPAWRRPLPFSYQSTGVETRFTNGLDPEPRSRPTFAFHRPDSLRKWLDLLPAPVTLPIGSGTPASVAAFAPLTFLALVRHLPPLVETGLWSAQVRAIQNLEASLAQNKPRALIQMATGSGKTYTAISFIYRLIKFAHARRVLFLVDRGNLGRQTKKEFDQYASPYNNYKFGEEYIVQHLTSNTLDTTARVAICTIQRLYSMLKGRELAEEDDEVSASGLESLFKSPEPIAYNPAIPIQGAVTNAALLLLGREESSTLLAPAVARMSWILKNERNEELDYQHFGPPFLLNVDKMLARIRNLTLRELPSGTLFPVEITQYDPWVIREALHNCIAHQDYGLRGRINVVETPDGLTLANVGGFLPGRVETVIEQDAPLEIYRNPFLAEAMVNLNMIDTQGGGIKRMFQAQRRRFFPLPDYDLSQPERVAVGIRGRILDERYTRLLMTQTDLDLGMIMLLDKVQKRQAISADDSKRLRAAKLVEGRYPNLVVAAAVAAATGEKAKHIRDRGFDSQYYRDLIVALIRKHQPVSREDIDRLLLDKLPEVLTDEQKRSKIHNLMSSLSGKVIRNAGTRQASRWVLIKQSKQ